MSIPIYALVLLVCALSVSAAPSAMDVTTTERVARGQQVTMSELAKSMAYVLHERVVNGVTNRHLCSATVVAKNWLLLAAHCVVGNGDLVRVGRFKWHDGSVHRVNLVRRHPLFKQNDYGFSADLTLVRFNPPAWHAKPIRLNTQWAVPQPEGEVYGFGYGVDEYGNLPYVLRKGMFVALAPWRCRWRFRESSLPTVANNIDGGMHLCANERVVGRGMCNGDSGGPLVMKTAAGLVQVGINSYRVVGKCGDVKRPDVYTRVSRFNWWIESVAGNAPGFVRVR